MHHNIFKCLNIISQISGPLDISWFFCQVVGIQSLPKGQSPQAFRMSYGWIANKNRWYSLIILNVRNTCWYLTVSIRTCPHLFAIVLFSAPGIFELLKILIADAIRNSFAIHTQTMRITYAIGMQYIRSYPLLFASSPLCCRCVYWEIIRVSWFLYPFCGRNTDAPHAQYNRNFL